MFHFAFFINYAPLSTSTVLTLFDLPELGVVEITRHHIKTSKVTGAQLDHIHYIFFYKLGTNLHSPSGPLKVTF